MEKNIDVSWHKQVDQSDGTKILIFSDKISFRDFTGYQITITKEAFDLMKLITEPED